MVLSRFPSRSLRALARALPLACALPLALAGASTATAADGGARPRSLLQALEGDAPRPGVSWSAPAPATPAGGIRLESFEFEGNAAFGDAELARVLAPYARRTLPPEELRELVDALLHYYHDHGYLAAHVSLPPQRIESGRVRLVLREGRVAASGLALAAVPAGDAESEAEPAATPGTAEAEEAPASALRFFSALPSGESDAFRRGGARPRATLVGTGQRAADRIVVELEEGPTRGFGPESDLFAGLPRHGWQVGATLQMANPAGRGGQLTARGVTDGSGVPFFSGRFDAPLDVTASTLATPGRYLDEERAAELGGLHADGQSTSLELAAERPLLDGRDLDLSLRGRLRHLDLRDQASGATTAERRIDSAQLGARGMLHDALLGGGTTAASLSTTFGLTDLDGFAPYARTDAEGPQTAGAFARIRASLARLQSLGGPWSLFGALMAQGASKNLDGSQQFSIGGLAPERGFAVGEAYGDEGFRLNADLRYAVPDPVLGGQLRLALFYDQGAIRLRRHAAEPEGNAVAHRSLGLSLRQDWSGEGFVHLSAGRQIGSTLAAAQAPESDSPYRFWLRVGMTF